MDATHPNAEGTLLQVKDPSSARSVIVEDDGRVAYAYLLDGKEIIADVWLYNVAPTPDEPDWKDRSQMPFLNPRAYCVSVTAVRVSENSDINCRWSESGVEVMIDGILTARLEKGSRPGWSRLAAKAGPLAKPLVA